MKGKASGKRAETNRRASPHAIMAPQGRTFENRKKVGRSKSGSVPQNTTGEVITAATGEQYYIIGKNKIKITEHFPASGKQLDELIMDLITQKIKEKAAEIS